MISRQPFGRSGHESTRILFGSWALSEATQKEADQVLQAAARFEQPPSDEEMRTLVSEYGMQPVFK